MSHREEGQWGQIKELEAYEVKSRRTIRELQSEGMVLEHKKTKARQIGRAHV